MAKEEKAAKTAAKTEQKAKSAPAKEKAPAKADSKAVKAPAKANAAEDGAAAKEEKQAARNYHVAKRPDGKWQVKFAGGEKAIKLFSTQAEAIGYAKKLAENQDGSISIHKKDGKMRKQKY